MKRIIIINGTLGIGKSSIANKISDSLRDSYYLEGDLVSNTIDGFNVYSEDKIKSAIQEIGTIAKYSLKHGLKTIVIDFVFENPSQIKYLKDLLLEYVEEVRVFYLEANEDEIVSRIKGRNRENFISELARTKEILEAQNEYVNAMRLGITVETSNQSIDEISTNIVFQLKHRLNAAAFIRDSEGKFLFCHRRDIPNKTRGFQLPQGGIDPFEVPEETIKRELQEELFLSDYKTIARTKSALPYYWKKGQIYDHYIGQLQYYFLLEVDDEQKKQISKSSDFDFYAWESIETILSNAVSYKKSVYSSAWDQLAEFND
ncbi:NUDIX domain-containing protein [bacterium]|nr:NUDIX domain-containing protein [bacterium]